MARAQAKTSGESQIISYNYQEKMQELQQKSMEKRQASNPGMALEGEQSQLMDPNQQGAQQGPQPGQDGSQAAPAPGDSGQAMAAGNYSDAQGSAVPGSAPGQTAGGDASYMDIHKTVKSWANKLMNMDPNEQRRMLMQVKQQMPQFGDMVEKALNDLKASAESTNVPGVSGAGVTPADTGVNMNPQSEQKAPTGKNAV